MKRFRVLLLPLFLVCFSLKAQPHSLSGKILDDSQSPIAYANILLIRVSDSTIVTGTTSDEEGLFKLNEISPGTYLFQVSFVGYKTHEQSIELSSDRVLGTIILKEESQELNEVTVSAKRPRMERKVDRLVFNVADTPLTEGTVWDILKQTPSVLILNDKITVKGEGNVTVYINDRKVYLPESDLLALMEGTTGASVESIEVITNPPARYDAEDGTIINIKMSKNVAAGYGGSIYGRYDQAVFAKYSLGTSQFYKSKKWNVYGDYNFRSRKELVNTSETVNYFENGQRVSQWNTEMQEIEDSQVHTATLNLDFSASERDYFGFSVTGQFTPRLDRAIDSRTEIFGLDEQLDSTFVSDNDTAIDRNNISTHLDYRHDLKNDASLTANVHYTYSDLFSDQTIVTDFFLPDGSFLSNETFSSRYDQKVNIYTGQLDYAHPLSETSNFETGLKAAFIDSENNIDQDRIGAMEFDTFLYDETTLALYGSWDKSWDEWEIKLGLRGEYTNALGNSLTENAKNRNEYYKLFPSFYLQYTPSEKHSYGINYGRSIYRPRYASINPFVYFINFNTTREGDPLLQPAIGQLLTLSYTLDRTYTFELYYRYEDSSERLLVFQNNENNTIRNVASNIDREFSYGFDFYTYTGITDFWSFNFLSSLFYSSERFRAIESGNELRENSTTTFYVDLSNDLTILKDSDLLINVNFLYASPLIWGATLVDGYSKLDLLLKKNIDNDRWVISAGIEDIFNDFRARSTTRYDNQDIVSFPRNETRLFTFRLRYNFGNQRLERNEDTKSVREQERLE